VFEKLGVDIPVSSTSIIAEIIEKEIDFSAVKTLAKLKKGDLIISEVLLSKKSHACNMRIMDMKLPKEAILMSVIRGNESFVPNGQTVLQENDTVFIICRQASQKDIIEYFT